MAENEQPETNADADDEPRGLAVAILSLIGHLLGTAACGGLGALFIAETVGASGPLWSRIGVGLAGTLVGIGGVWLSIRGVARFVHWVRTGEYARHLEYRAAKRGLPTEPEAYQDGGLAVAASVATLHEAEVLALALNQAGVPAWVPDRETVAWDWLLQNAIRPGGMRVMVPLGRLQDACEVLEARQDLGAPVEPETEDTHGAKTEPVEDPAVHLADRSKRLFLILCISVMLTAPFVLPASLWVFMKAWKGFETTGGAGFKQAMLWSTVTGVIALFMLIVVAVILLPVMW